MMRPSLFNTLAIGMKLAYSVVKTQETARQEQRAIQVADPIRLCSKFTHTHTLQGDTYERITQEPLFDGNSASMCDCFFRSARKD